MCVSSPTTLSIVPPIFPRPSHVQFKTNSIGNPTEAIEYYTNIFHGSNHDG